MNHALVSFYETSIPFTNIIIAWFQLVVKKAMPVVVYPSQETPHAAVERWLGRPDLREMLVGEGAFLALE
jgi:hypothetical protein